MLRVAERRIVVVAGLFFALTSARAAVAQMYATGINGGSGPSTFYTVDPTTGTATAVGPVGFNRCGGLDVGPGDVVYAACEDLAAVPVLITINPATGAGTQIGPTGLSGSIGDISFRPSDGTLFAYDASNSPTHMLATINTTTGAGTIVGDTGLGGAGGNGMSFSLGGTLFHSQTASLPDPELNTLNQSTGAATFVMDLPIPGGCANNCRFSAMDVDPATGLLFAVLNDAASGPGNRSLATINTTTGGVVIIGPTAADLDAIAFATFVPVELQSLTIE